MFNNNTIRKKVLAIVEAKIAVAQKSYNDTCISLTSKHKKDIIDLNKKLQDNKEASANRLVESILGKIL